MKGRRSLIGLCLLCALAAGAIAAQGASAVTGTTAFTCKKTGKGDFTKAHCKSSDSGSGEYSEVEIPEGLQTELKGTNANSGSNTTEAPVVKLKNSQAGVNYEIQVTEAHGEGWATNAKDTKTGEHYVHGAATVTFTGVTITQPAGKGCKIKEGKIESKPLIVTTKGQGDFVKFEPSGTELATYVIEGCTIEALNGAEPVTGTIKCPLDGATVVCTHSETTALGTFKGAGQKTGIEGALTLSAKNPEKEEEFTPVAATTVE